MRLKQKLQIDLYLSKNSKRSFSVYICHGQYLVYSSKSSIFEECIIVFQVLVSKQMFSFFEECIIVFQAPAQFQKKKMYRILLSINQNFGCS